MKKLLLLLFFIPAISRSQNLTLPAIDTTRDDKGKFVISSVLKATDSTLSKDRVFEKLKYVIYKNYGSGAEVIHYESKDEGVLYFRARTHKLVYVNTTFVGSKEKRSGGIFSYEGKILCKQGKAKIILNEITHSGGGMPQMRDGADFGDYYPSGWGKMQKSQIVTEWASLKDQAFNEFKSLIALANKELQASILTKEQDF